MNARPVLLLCAALFAAPLAAQEMTVATPLGDAPVTARVARTAAAAGGVVVLAIEGIEGRSIQPIRINVFADAPTADHATPTTDPHFVGAIQLLPRGGKIGKIGAVFDLTDHVPQTAGPVATTPLAITLVPVVGTQNDAPTGVALKIARISIRTE